VVIQKIEQLVAQVRREMQYEPEPTLQEPLDEGITFTAFLFETTVQYIIKNDLPPPYGRHFMPQYFEPLALEDEEDLAHYINEQRNQFNS
jgi:hypothetical protein